MPDLDTQIQSLIQAIEAQTIAVHALAESNQHLCQLLSDQPNDDDDGETYLGRR